MLFLFKFLHCFLFKLFLVSVLSFSCFLFKLSLSFLGWNQRWQSQSQSSFNQRWQSQSQSSWMEPAANPLYCIYLLHQGHQAFPLQAYRHFHILQFLTFRLSGISAFCNFWHFRFVAFPHSAISGRHFRFLQFLAFPQLLVFPWPWKFWLAVFSSRFMIGSDQCVCGVELQWFYCFIQQQ